MNIYSVLFSLVFSSLCHNWALAKDKETFDSDETRLPYIFISNQAQKFANIQSKIINQTRLNPELKGSATVLNLSEINSQHINYLHLTEQKKRLRKHLQRAKRNLDRIKKLHRNDGVSNSKLDNYHAEFFSAESAFQANQLKIANLENQNSSTWGSEISAWITELDSFHINQLKQNGSVIKLILPYNERIPAALNQIYTHHTHNRNSAHTATFVTELPQLNPTNHGHQYIFKLSKYKYKSNTLLNVWIPENTESQTGIIIPDSAIVWHLGQILIYIQKEHEQFVPIRLEHPLKLSQGYFSTDQTIFNKSIVIKGAQTIFSEEFKAQIPEEDDDD